MQKTNPRPLLIVLFLMGTLATKSDASSSSNNPSYYPEIISFTLKKPSFGSEDDLARGPPKIPPSADGQFFTGAERPQPNESSVDLFDGGCVVSAEAIMCTGGDGFVEFHPREIDDEEKDEESDDDDDDDSDGHSSMLSNASLKRPKVGANGFQQRPPRQSQETQHDQKTSVVVDVMPASTRTSSSTSFNVPVGRKHSRLFGMK